MLDVALNASVLQESKKDKAEMNQVYMLALSFAQQQHGFRLSHQYTIVSHSPKSSPDDLYRRLGFQQRPNTAKQPDTGGVKSQYPEKLLKVLFFGATFLCWCSCIIFHLLPDFLIIHNVLFYRHTDTSCPPAADLLSTFRETRQRSGSTNYL